MPLLLLFFFALLLPAQTVLSLSPSGDRPTPLPNCPECAAFAQIDGHGLEPLIKVVFTTPVNPDAFRDRIYIEFGPSRQTDGFLTYPTGYRMPINQLAWDAARNTLYARPDDPLDHDRDYTLVVTNGLRPIATSIFHTQNITRDILARQLAPAGTLRRITAETIDLTQLASLEFLYQTSADPTAPFTVSTLPVDPTFLTTLGLRRLVLLDFVSPRGERLHVHAWLPNTPPPPSGWPVKLIGHGLFDNRFSGPTLFASAFVSNSVVMSIDAVGHGFGPASRLRFTNREGVTLEVPAGGRGVDLNRDGRIDPSEGCILLTPTNPDFTSTCLRETALDYRQLIREIQQNIDLTGDGRPDLDSNSIQYLGQSLGAMYGTLLTALDPSLEAAVLNVGGGSAVETSRTSALIAGLTTQFLTTLYPHLANVPDPLTPRFVPAQPITSRQAELLEVLDRFATIETRGAPASFAPFLKQATLFGNPIKRVLFQFALGDQSVPNNANQQLQRAAHEYFLISLYRHDLARRAFPNLPANPHAYLAAFAQIDQPSLFIALATLTQASNFLASGRYEVPDVNGLVRPIFRADLFETPATFPW